MMWGYGVGWVFMLAWWALVVVGIVWLVRTVTDRGDSASASSARRILDERFASGQLSVEEYEERRRVLS